MKSILFNTVLLALSALQVSAAPPTISWRGDIDKRSSTPLTLRGINARAVQATADDRPWDLDIQTKVEGDAHSVASLAVDKISQMITLGEHVVTDETYLVEDNSKPPRDLMADFANYIAGVFSGYGVVAAQEKGIVGNPHFNYIWLGAEFRSQGFPTIRADVVVSKNINWYIDVKLNLPDGSIVPFVTSGAVNVVTQSDQGYERVTFTG